MGALNLLAQVADKLGQQVDVFRMAAHIALPNLQAQVLPFNRALYQTTSTSYLAIWGSEVRIGSSSTWLWATSMRSNGSRWYFGRECT